MPTLGEALAKNLEKLRKSKNLTQQQLAEALGVTRQSIARYESGTGGATLDAIAKLADFFKVEETELFSDSPGPDFQKTAQSLAVTIQKHEQFLIERTEALANGIAKLTTSPSVQSKEMGPHDLKESQDFLQQLSLLPSAQRKKMLQMWQSQLNAVLALQNNRETELKIG